MKRIATVAMILATTLSAHADTFFWVGATGDYNTASNWDSNSVPTSADEMRIDNGGTAQISSGTAEADILILANASDSTGRLTMTGSCVLNVGNLLKIGARGLATMDVGADANVSAGNVYVGINEIGSGERTLNLAGSMSVGGNMFVASSGATGVVNLVGGSLTVADDFDMANHAEEDYRSATLTINGSSGSFSANNFSGADEDVTLEFIADAVGFMTLVITNAINIAGATLNIDLDAYAGTEANLVLMDGGSLNGTFASVNITGSETAILVYDTANGDLLLTSPQAAAKGHQRVIEWIDQLPNQPGNYSMRDWNKVARDLDAILYDWNATGTNLPLIELDTDHYNYPSWNSFSFGAYVGRDGNGTGPRAMVNGVLAGVDKRNQGGHNYFTEVQQYYCKKDGYNTYAQTPKDNGDADFNFYASANTAFYQFYDGNSDIPNFPEQFAGVADKWYDILGIGMGGVSNGWANFGPGLSGFDMNTWQLIPGESWTDTSGAFAYLEYMAWRELGDPKYLGGVDWCLNFLLRQQVSPLYEWHMSYAPYVAARRNLEADDRRYDVHKLVTWCFEPDPAGVRTSWGMKTDDEWPNAIISPGGLIGGQNSDKAFLSATGITAYNVKGLVKYDDRYARVIGKWLLHSANAARLWYANGLPAANQNPYDKPWADQYDTNYAITYEQVQKSKLLMQFPVEDMPVAGTVTGNYDRLNGELEKVNPNQILKEVDMGAYDKLEHAWRIPVDKATTRKLVMTAKMTDAGDSDSGFTVSYALGSPSGWSTAFTVSGSAMAEQTRTIDAGGATTVYVKVVDNNRASGTSLDTLEIDSLYVSTADTAISPYATGPWRSNKIGLKDWSDSITGLALYQAFEVGRLAVGFGTTDVEQILDWDLNAADSFKGPCYPTHLYYNPYPITQTIHVDVGATPVDLYDTVSETFLGTGVTGVTPIMLPSDFARVVVRTPAAGTIRYPVPYRMEIDGVMVDYLSNRGEEYHESFENSWPTGAVVSGAALSTADAYDGSQSILLNGQDSVTIPISSSGLTRLEVAYARRINGAAANDEFFCEFYDGHTWQELEYYVGVERAPGTTWKMKYIDVPATADDNANFQLRFRVNYSQGEARVDLLTISASAMAAATDFVTWQRNHFATAEIEAGLADRANDFDSDGLSNELEYYFGLDPRNTANARRPAASVVESGGIDYPGITYTRRNNATNIHYVVQISYDLATWISVTRDEGGSFPFTYTVAAGPIDNFDNTETLTLRYNLDLASLPGNSIFLRIAANSTEVVPAEQPNILFILVDDMGWADLSCYPTLNPGDPESETPTPNIDKIAASGVRFTSGYADHLVCAPTRAAIMSGRHQQRIGWYGFPEAMAGIDKADATLLPVAMSQAGYTTALIGKWHLGFLKGSTPLDCGFDRFFGFLGGSHDFFVSNFGQSLHGISGATDGYIYDQDQPVQYISYLTDEFTDRSIEFVADSLSAKKPFFLYLSYNAPHAPMQAPWEDVEPFAAARTNEEYTSRDTFRAMVIRLDRNIGRLMNYLEETGQTENTLVIFASDNGGMQTAYNGGLKGRKGYFSEGGIRVPMMASWPGTIPPGQVLDVPVITHDVYKTALGAAGVTDVPDGVEGVNWIPYLTGEETEWPSRPLFWGNKNDTVKWAVRDGNWKLVNDDTNNWFGGWPTQEPNSEDRPKAVYGTQLFDVTADPKEQNDLSADHPETVTRLQGMINDFYASCPASLYTPEVEAKSDQLKEEREDLETYPRVERLDGAPGHYWQKEDTREHKNVIWDYEMPPSLS